jgi:hypothetical protein
MANCLLGERVRAMVNPALSVLEYAMEQKGKDIRGAMAAAKEVLDRAKPEDGEEGTEVRNTVNFRFFDNRISAVCQDRSSVTRVHYHREDRRH